MSMRLQELRELLNAAGRRIRIPRAAFELDGLVDRVAAVFPGGELELEAASGRPDQLTATGQVAPSAGEEPLPVRAEFSSDGAVVTGVSVSVGLPRQRLPHDEITVDLAPLVAQGFSAPEILLTAGAPTPHRANVPAGSWCLLRLPVTGPTGATRDVEFRARISDLVPDAPLRFTSAPGTELAAHTLGAALGLADAPALPGSALAPLTDLTVTHHPDTRASLVLGRGDHGRLAVLRHADGAGLLIIDGADGDWQVLSASRTLDRAALAAIVAPLTAEHDAGPRTPLVETVDEGTWLVLPRDTAPLTVPLRARPRPLLDPGNRDGLGRPLPKDQPVRRSAAWLRANRARRYAVATRDGFLLLDAVGPRRIGRRAPVTARAVTPAGWTAPKIEDGIVSIAYRKPPLAVTGALTTRPAESPYAQMFGGALTVNAQAVNGAAVAAFVVPESGQAGASFFGYGMIGRKKGIGPPPFQVRGIAGGMGWNSHIRTPEVDEISAFPFVQILKNTGPIAGKGRDAAEILKALDAWITPGDDQLWIAAGLAFSSFEMLKGEAMLLLQTGPDLTIALLGRAGIDFPPEGSKKYARLAIAIRAALKPAAGELSMSAQLTDDSFVIDKNCKVRGGSAAVLWFGDNPNRGDFVYTIGGYHPHYERHLPDHYPRVPRLGLDWGVGSTVSISGGAYFAITPAAVMAGGKLEVRFHSGMVRAWLDAWVDALVQWKPFYFDVGIGVYIGVQASVKVVFVRITITVEVGADIRVWGPETGGEARVKLWFVSFTIGFGASRGSRQPALDWPGFRGMLPPAENIVRIIAGDGLLGADGVEGTLSDTPAWQVSASGFAFRTDSAVPLTEIYLGDGRTPEHSRGGLRIRPMDRGGLTSTHRVELTHGGDAVDLDRWSNRAMTSSVAAALYGSGDGGTLPGKDDHLVADKLTGIELTSPPVSHGTTTGDISEEALAFTPISPDGPQPLDPAAGPEGPRAEYPGGTIQRIVDTVATATRADRDALAAALTGFGAELGDRDSELPGYARDAATAFTAEPMLVAAS
ncbi:DUF6603 domain-containing protein [Marinactinospora rubrisoli]|uniref:DUF6603 domain-containing protein n=1 Tax=Marinactinospora rubrisoli TaxID=2715399 RepID=A0ABW2KL99_9ACTN